MSFIDNFDHEYVGHFAGLPIYHPLEDVVPTHPDGEFRASVNNLVVGGGWLEHPALVFNNLDYLAAVFIFDWLGFCDDHKNSAYSDEETDVWAEKIHGYCYKHLQEHGLGLNFIQWSLRDYSEFYASCKASAMRVPFIETDQRNAFEPWLLSNFGELVVFTYPELIIDPEVSTIAKKVDRYLYGNVAILPPGYPRDSSGRKTVDGKIIQGHRGWKATKNV